MNWCVFDGLWSHVLNNTEVFFDARQTRAN
jgi:hypothetical protein